MSAPERSGLARGERAARLVLWLLVLAVPAAYAPRLFGNDTSGIAPRRPAWVHLVVVTAGEWPALDGAPPAHPALAELERRAAGIERVYAPAIASAGSAASLWTGRWPANHGVLSNELALPEGAWTLAESARRRGAATAAFLEEPFVTATRIDGFERVVEERDLGPNELARLASEFLTQHQNERVVVWAHLRRAGERAERVADVLAAIQAALAPRGRRFDTLTVVTAFSSAASRDTDAWLRVPLRLELPSALFARRRGAGTASLVDVAGLVCQLMRLPLPDPSRGDGPLQSRPSFAGSIKGASNEEWLVLQRPSGDVMRYGAFRLEARERPATGNVVLQESPDPAGDAGFHPIGGGPLRAKLLADYQLVLKQVLDGATAAVPAEVPAAWQGSEGW